MRLLLFKSWMNLFVELYGSELPLVFQEGSPELLTDLYFSTMRKRVKAFFYHDDSRIDHHKITSLIEMTVMLALPIRHDDQGMRLTLNARFAFWCSSSFLIEWHAFSGGKMGDDAAFERAHLDWLMLCDQELFPVFSNAATWYLYERLTVSPSYAP